MVTKLEVMVPSLEDFDRGGDFLEEGEKEGISGSRVPANNIGEERGCGDQRVNSTIEEPNIRAGGSVHFHEHGSSNRNDFGVEIPHIKATLIFGEHNLAPGDFVNTITPNEVNGFVLHLGDDISMSIILSVHD